MQPLIFVPGMSFLRKDPPTSTLWLYRSIKLAMREENPETRLLNDVLHIEKC